MAILRELGDAERLSNTEVVDEVEVDDDKLKEFIVEQKKPSYSGKLHYKLNARDKEAHINYILYKEIDISLDIATDIAFGMLNAFDVDDDKLEELEHYFIQAKVSLKCYGDAFDKLERAKMDEV